MIIIVVLKYVILWLLSGLLFNVLVEGLPLPEDKMTRAKKRIMIFDILMGPIGYFWFGALGIKKFLLNRKK